MPPKNSHPTATSLRVAFDQVHQALGKKRISADRAAELLGTSVATYYKWLEECRMPADKLALIEHIADNHAVTRYFAHRGHLMVIDIPRGKGADASDINALQGVLNNAAGALIAFMAHEIDAAETMSRLTTGMEALAYYREDVRKHAAPELDLELPQ